MTNAKNILRFSQWQRLGLWPYSFKATYHITYHVSDVQVLKIVQGTQTANTYISLRIPQPFSNCKIPLAFIMLCILNLWVHNN